MTPCPCCARAEAPGSSTRAGEPTVPNGEGAGNGPDSAAGGRTRSAATPTMGEHSQGLTEADLATIAARANAHSRQDILRLVAEVRRLEADLDRAVDWALEHRGGEAQARHQLARATSRAEAAEADARELREDVGAAIRVLPGGTVSRPLAGQITTALAEAEQQAAAQALQIAGDLIDMAGRPAEGTVVAVELRSWADRIRAGEPNSWPPLGAVEAAGEVTGDA